MVRQQPALVPDPRPATVADMAGLDLLFRPLPDSALAVAAGTVRTRAAQLGMWRRWRDAAGLPHHIPSSFEAESGIVEFVFACLSADLNGGKGYRYNSIRVAAYEVLRHHNVVLKIQMSGDVYGVMRGALKRVQAFTPDPLPKITISGEELKIVMDTLDPNDFNDLAIRTFLVVSFVTCSRPCNLARSALAADSHLLVWAGVTVFPDLTEPEGICFTERSSKVSSLARQVWAGSCSDKAVCPVAHVMAWREMLSSHRPCVGGDAFLWWRTTAGAFVELTPAHVNKWLLRRQARLNVHAGARLTARCMRGSGATALLSVGVSDRDVAARAGWKINVMERYYARDGKLVALQTTDAMMRTTIDSLSRGVAGTPEYRAAPACPGTAE